MAVEDSRTIPAGTVLFRPGDPCPGFVLVQSGNIRVSLTAASGREIVLYRVGPGDICLQTFSCLIDGRTYSAEGVAETEIAAEIVPATAFQQRIAQDPDFRNMVFSAVAHRFSDFEKLVEDVALSGFEARLARVLLRLSAENSAVEATHEALATETGSGRAVVSRQLAEFARRGWVTLSRRRVTIEDRGALEGAALDG